MQMAKQLSVMLANKPGRLAAMLGALNKEKIGFRALAVMDSGERGTVRFVPEDFDAAKRVLDKISVPYDPSDVLLVDVPGQAGAFRKICEKLAADHLNIDYAYSSFDGGKSGKPGGLAVIRVNDLLKAQQALGVSSVAARRAPRRQVRRPVQAPAL
jgi:hypothetical protein